MTTRTLPLLLLLLPPAWAQAPVRQPRFPLQTVQPPAFAHASAVRVGDNLVFFAGDAYLSFSLTEGRPAGQGSLRSWPGWPQTWTGVTTAFRFGPDTIIFVGNSGADFASYSVSRQSFASAPQPLQAWPGFPWPTISRAVNWDDSTIVFFHQNLFVRYTLDGNGGGRFDSPGAMQNWPGWPTQWTAVEGVFNPGDQFVYFTRNGQAVAFDFQSAAFTPPFSFVQAAPAPAPAPAATQPAPTTPQPLKKKYLLRTSNGFLVTAEGGGGRGAPDAMATNRRVTGPWEAFALIPLGNDTYAFRTESGHYLSAEAGGLSSSATVVGPAETFTFERLGGGAQLALRTALGTYVSARNGGGATGPNAVTADAPQIGPAETFTLAPTAIEVENHLVLQARAARDAQNRARDTVVQQRIQTRAEQLRQYGEAEAVRREEAAAQAAALAQAQAEAAAAAQAQAEQEAAARAQAEAQAAAQAQAQAQAEQEARFQAEQQEAARAQRLAAARERARLAAERRKEEERRKAEESTAASANSGYGHCPPNARCGPPPTFNLTLRSSAGFVTRFTVDGETKSVTAGIDQTIELGLGHSPGIRLECVACGAWFKDKVFAEFQLERNKSCIQVTGDIIKGPSWRYCN